MLNSHKRLLIGISVLVLIGVIGLGISQFFTLRRAHSSFANYYSFRGCVQLIQKTNYYGTCRISTGQVIKIVEFRGEWYLNNDLPTCIKNVCL